MLAALFGSRARSISGILSRLLLCATLGMTVFGGTARVGAVPGSTTTLVITSGGTSVATVAAGSIVTLTATVSAGSTPVTIGQVNFCDATATFCTGTHLIGTAQLTSGGTASFKFVPPVGSHSYEAVFAGTGNNVASASGASALTVTPAAGKQSVTTTLAQSGSAGNITLTATVAGSVTSSGSVAPTGNVSFVDTSNANTVLGTALLGPGTFGQSMTVSQTLTVGLHPKTVLVADVNADGILDIISGGDGVVSVLIGNGDGTFQTANNITALPSNPWITTTSFRNGGPVDILTVSDSVSNVNNAAIIFGNGTGGVLSVNPFSLPFGSASAVTSADFNGDGQQDFAVVFKLDNKISTFLGEGVGQFQAATTLATGSAPVAAVVGNFNGHGKIDIAVANSGDNTISIYLGSTSGSEGANPFTVVTPVQTFFSPTSIAVGDLNGDGIDDLLVTGTDSHNNNVVAFFFGKGSGAFTTGTLIPELQAPFGIVAADVLGNGKLDIVVTKPGANALDLFLNDGAGNFSQGVITPATGSSPMFLAAGNFNGQATQDLAVANNGDGTVSVFVSQLIQSASASLPGVSSAGLDSLRAVSSGGVTESNNDNIVAQYSGDANFAAATSTPIVVAVNNPVPTITTLSPTSVVAGTGAFTLTVNGTGFVAGATVSFGGANKTTSFTSATQVTAQILATDITSVGTPAVVVTNPTPGGGASNSVNFNVTNTANPVPTLTSLSPNSVSAGSGAFTLAVNGTNFVTGSSVSFNGQARTTTFVSSTQVTAAILATDVSSVNFFSVNITNPAPGGGTSPSPLTFNVTTPVPAITTLAPNTAVAGGAGFNMIVNGSNFISTSVVQWNGGNRTTTFVSATQLSAAITAADISAVGTASVKVFTPTVILSGITSGGPSGTTSNTLTFTITAANPVPTLTSISPTSIGAGGAAFTLTLTGTNFISSSVTNFKGSPRATTFVSATQLTAAITAADIATSGTAAITVVTPAPGGGPTSAVNLTITDFSVTSPNPTQTVTAGQTASFTIATAPVGGAFTGNVTFSTSVLPQGAAASFNPTSVASGSSTTMSITTTARGTSLVTQPPFNPNGPSRPWWLVAFLLTVALASITIAKFGRRNFKRLIPVGAFALLLISAGYLSGCAGSGFPKVGSNTGTPAGTYPITVTGTSGTVQHATTVTLIVQ